MKLTLRYLPLCGTLLLGASAHAQSTSAPASTQPGQTLNRTYAQVPGTLGQALPAANQTVGGLNQTVGSLQPTLQPLTQGVGGAVNNLTQPDTINALLQFLSSVVPNHIEAHVNLDALRVEKLTVDVRGVDLRNLRVDLLVANSRSMGAQGTATNGVQPVMGNRGTQGSTSGTTNPTSTQTPLPYQAPNTTTPAPTR